MLSKTGMGRSLAKLTTDRERHRYWWGGVRIPSVTDILEFANITNVDYATTAGLNVGREIHRLTLKFDLEGEIPEAEMVGKVRGPMIAYQEAMAFLELNYTQLEELVADPKRWYAGRLDRGGKTRKGDPFLLDVKKRGHASWHGLQLAGYDLADGRWKPGERKRYGLYIQANGSWKLRPHKNLSDYRKFLDAVETYHTKGGAFAKAA